MRGIERNLSLVKPIMTVSQKFENMATIIWTKLQNEVARIKPTRVNIDISSAETVLEKLKIVYPEIDITHLIHALNSGLGFGAVLILTTILYETIDHFQQNLNH